MFQILDKVRSFKEKKFHRVAKHYKSLEKAQSPHTLIVTCSDSRILPHEIFQAKAGELFIIRNAGNLIPPPHLENPSNEAVSIEYGVVALGVKEVLICGHKSCGAMRALMEPSSLAELPLVKKGLENYKTEHNINLLGLKDVDELISWNVRRQLKNLMEYEFIRERVFSGELRLGGMVYDFVNAEVSDQVEVDQRGDLKTGPPEEV